VELTFIIGSLGSWDPLNRDTLKALQIGNKYARLFRKLCLRYHQGIIHDMEIKITEPLTDSRINPFFFYLTISYTFSNTYSYIPFAQLTFRITYFVLSLIPGIAEGFCVGDNPVFSLYVPCPFKPEMNIWNCSYECNPRTRGRALFAGPTSLPILSSFADLTGWSYPTPANTEQFTYFTYCQC